MNVYVPWQNLSLFKAGNISYFKIFLSDSNVVFQVLFCLACGSSQTRNQIQNNSNWSSSSDKSRSLTRWANEKLQVCFCLFVFVFYFLGLYTQHMEFPKLGVKSELQLLPYTIATAMPDLSFVCNPQHSSWQRRILNQLSKARDWTWNLIIPSQIHFRCATKGTPSPGLFWLMFL